MENITKWHESGKINENGVCYFIKKYEPNSYEIKNELKWLTSEMLKSCKSFKLPEVIDANEEKGYIKMEYIDSISNINKDNIINNLIKISIDLHNLFKYDEPTTRIKTTKENYKNYLKSFVGYRLNIIQNEHPEIMKIENFIMNNIENLNTNYFNIVHRDFRLRHLLLNKNNNENYLIDWEFSNISDYGQDLAKLIYDCVINHKIDKKYITNYLVKKYSNGTGVSADEIKHKINTFLPIIPLEHSASFIKRKPKGYELEVSKDIAFILSLYEKK